MIRFEGHIEAGEILLVLDVPEERADEIDASVTAVGAEKIEYENPAVVA